MYASDSLETILSHFSMTVMNGIVDGSCLYHLNYLLEFLAAWESRPAYSTPMAYRWCSAISEAAGRPNTSGITIEWLNAQQGLLHNRARLRPQDSSRIWFAESEFSRVGPGHDPVHLDATSHHTRRRPQDFTPPMYAHLLSIALEIGFRHVMPSRDQSFLHLDHTSHHEWVFETALSSDDDEVIADAVCAWIIGSPSSPPGSCAHYLANRVERDTPFSPRLRQASIYAIERIWYNELKVSGLEAVRWLNRLNIDADDVVGKGNWMQCFISVICSPTGPESLSFHHWHLLDKLVVASEPSSYSAQLLRDMEVMSSLEEAEDWEKLGVWMVVVWSHLPFTGTLVSGSMEVIEKVTLKSILRRPSTLQEFEGLCGVGSLSLEFQWGYKCKLQRICDQARAEQLPSESPPPCVSVHTAQRPPVLMPSLFTSGNRLTSNNSSPLILRETTVSETVCRIYYGLM